MAETLPILPGSTVVVRDVTSIYNGYQGFVQRISGRMLLCCLKAATGTSW